MTVIYNSVITKGTVEEALEDGRAHSGTARIEVTDGSSTEIIIQNDTDVNLTLANTNIRGTGYTEINVYESKTVDSEGNDGNINNLFIGESSPSFTFDIGGTYSGGELFGETELEGGSTGTISSGDPNHTNIEDIFPVIIPPNESLSMELVNETGETRFYSIGTLIIEGTGN